MSDPHGVKTLGAYVKLERIRRRLEVHQAATLAELPASTWQRTEDGDQEFPDEAYSKIEYALGWTGGSCRRIIDGGEPQPIEGDGPGITL